MSDYEDILRDMRQFGSYQRRVFILVSLFDIPTAWSMILPVFIGANPGWECPVLSSMWNSTSDDKLYTLNNTNLTAGTCLPDKSTCDGVTFKKDFTSILTEFGLICDNDYVADLIMTIQMAGVVVGAAVTGQLADTFGRRPVLYLEHLILVILWFCCAFVGSWQAYAALRFVIGGLTGGIILVAFVLPIEFITPKWRSFCGCIGLWAVGLATLSLWGYLIRDWRHLLIGTSATSALFLITFWFVPESPRWLLQQHRYDEAEKILTLMAKSNNKPLPDLSPLKRFVEEEEKKKKVLLKYSYWHLFATRKLTKCTIILAWCWFCCGAIYYGVQLNVKNLSGSRYINLLLSGVVETPTLIFVLVAANIIGRRRTFLVLIMIVGASMFSIFVMSLVGKMNELPDVVRALAMIGKAGISGGWGACMIFSGESFPTVIRNIGVGAVSTAARIGGVVAPQIVYLSTLSKPLPYAVIGCMAFSCGLLILLLPETKDMPLSDKLIETSVTDTTSESESKENGLVIKIKDEGENLMEEKA